MLCATQVAVKSALDAPAVGLAGLGALPFAHDLFFAFRDIGDVRIAHPYLQVAEELLRYLLGHLLRYLRCDRFGHVRGSLGRQRPVAEL